jgi:hypothetical protein
MVYYEPGSPITINLLRLLRTTDTYYDQVRPITITFLSNWFVIGRVQWFVIGPGS